MRVIVTDHAIQRYQERVEPCTEDEARSKLSNTRIASIISFGAKMFRLGTGHRVIVNDGVIITVLPIDARNKVRRFFRERNDD